MYSAVYSLKEELRNIIDEVGIDEYHRMYLKRMLPAIDYYTDIYLYCLNRIADRLPHPLRDATIVDFGGGHGLLSIAAKRMGWGRVIYIDRDAKAVNTARRLSERLSVEIDTILQGDENDLIRWASRNGVHIDAIAGMDVIEHIYRPQQLFSNIAGLTQKPYILLTTASNPYNKLKAHRLHRIMRSDDTGTTENPNFYTLRYQFIKEKYGFDAKQTAEWAKATRGLTYKDIIDTIDSGLMPEPEDSYNTCDPRTGNWTERIVPIETYKRWAEEAGYTLSVGNGWYNSRCTGIKRLTASLLNRTDSKRLAPFIILELQP